MSINFQRSTVKIVGINNFLGIQYLFSVSSSKKKKKKEKLMDNNIVARTFQRVYHTGKIYSPIRNNNRSGFIK